MPELGGKARKVRIFLYTPDMLLTCYRITEYLKGACPDFVWDFKSLFFGVGIRVRSSEELHIDWGDCHRGGMAFVVTLTEWTGGGDINLPQLGVSIRPLAGDVTCFQAGRLLHEATSPEDGERVVLTLFTCNNLFVSAFPDTWKEKNYSRV
jgi:hypothetical protein